MVHHDGLPGSEWIPGGTSRYRVVSIFDLRPSAYFNLVSTTPMMPSAVRQSTEDASCTADPSEKRWTVVSERPFSATYSPEHRPAWPL